MDQQKNLMSFTMDYFFLLILCVQMMLLLSMTMVTLWMKKVAYQITSGFIHSVNVSDCLAGTALGTGDTAGTRTKSLLLYSGGSMK